MTALRDWWTTVQLLRSARRANRRYLRRYARYGPSCGATPEEIRAMYKDVGDLMMKAISGR